MLGLLALFAMFMFGACVESFNAGCDDVDNVITCTAEFEEELGFVNLDIVAEADLKLDFETLTVELDFLINQLCLFSTSFGLDSPPELCADVMNMHVCLELIDLKLDDWIFSGCLAIDINDKTIELGCFATK